MAFNSTSIARIKSYFLKGVLTIYIIAFTSLYVQVQPLFGDNGVVPMRDNKAISQLSGPLNLKSIILIAPKIGLSYGTFIELLCILGIVTAFASLFIKRLANALSFGLLWFIYYSLCHAGQGFMNFHSDLMLLEVGFLSILIAPLVPTSRISQADHDHLSFFLIKWIVFRYSVTNVLNVYLDNDKAWYNMTAIPMVAQGIQFPSLFSWQIFNLPVEYIKLYQAYEHAVKLVAPFLILLDLKLCRLLGFYTLLFVYLPAALFFNFGWTDLLISICLLSFLKDAYFYTDKRAKQSGLKTLLDFILVAGYVALIVTILIEGYGLKYDKGSIKTQVKFTPAQFKIFADHFVPVSLVFGLLGLLSAAYVTYFKSSKKTSVIKSGLYSLVVVGLFVSTFPTITRFSPNMDLRFKTPMSASKEMSRFVAPYMLSNNYLIVSRVSEHYAEGRPELQVQGRESSEDPTWTQFDLRYKPGHPSKELLRVVPHLPRLDLKMWYAARSTLQNNQWLQTLAYRVATAEKSVMNAFAPTQPSTKVNQIRIVNMKYLYSQKGKQPFAGYWSQSKFVSEYMSPLNVDNLRFNVKSSGISLTPPSKTADDNKSNSLDKLLNKYLEISSDYIRNVNHQAVIWTLSAIAAVSLLR